MRLFNRPAFGNAVRAYRTQQNISRSQLARRAGVNRFMVAKVEEGSYSEAPMLVAFECGLDVRQFIFEDDQMVFNFIGRRSTTLEK